MAGQEDRGTRRRLRAAIVGTVSEARKDQWRDKRGQRNRGTGGARRDLPLASRLRLPSQPVMMKQTLLESKGKGAQQDRYHAGLQLSQLTTEQDIEGPGCRDSAQESTPHTRRHAVTATEYPALLPPRLQTAI